MPLISMHMGTRTHRLMNDAQASARDAAADHANAMTQLDALKHALAAREQQLQDASVRVEELQQAQQRAEQAAANRERNLVAQVEQLEDEMARCQADKARAVAQAQDAEHVHQHLRGLLDQAQEQTEAILAEFHEDEDGVAESAPATACGHRQVYCCCCCCGGVFQAIYSMGGPYTTILQTNKKPHNTTTPHSPCVSSHHPTTIRRSHYSHTPTPTTPPPPLHHAPPLPMPQLRAPNQMIAMSSVESHTKLTRPNVGLLVYPAQPLVCGALLVLLLQVGCDGRWGVIAQARMRVLQRWRGRWRHVWLRDWMRLNRGCMLLVLPWGLCGVAWVWGVVLVEVGVLEGG